MPKRKYQASPIQATKPTSVCDYCEKEFTTRGMTSHLKKCIKKRAHDIATAEKTRTYNFSILNESVHEVIVSFLSNQTLTKLQMITGDHFEECEPELAGFCCECENDNPVIAGGLCRKCIPKELMSHASRPQSSKRYGVRKKDIRDVTSEHGHRKFSWRMLEHHMIKLCGSKKEWL
ncbi:hypothetical protein Pcac1_g11369 [Phytophthora cactorum]|uniref:Uncharacterized protein n=1 Tax=Phytophthora cactorum TaxID=29920 RepID=A0A329T3C7_9STRA|nr:hypothetical protein Pcac1_g11369 [Phytophthora cactorum]KAG2817261.1 hypothetical protein PC112_g13131 [Phytophthora cactorum]KAG2819335.1 hypothetical protein PC111_g11942 [Phytophthora cactorum]KAG3040366.1 hypothetical protein PC119_g1460 [Phytophthora cactorum]KAG3156623.1 hypothetical protein C6341_g15000 [Phytophthora cactorum]